MICWLGWGSKSNQKPSQIETVSVSSCDPTFKKRKKRRACPIHNGTLKPFSNKNMKKNFKNLKMLY